MSKLIKRLIASANYRLNEAPYRLEPRGSEAYRMQWQGAQAHRVLQREAQQFSDSLQFNSTADFTGAGGFDCFLLDRYIRQEMRPRMVLELAGSRSSSVLASASSGDRGAQ